MAAVNDSPQDLSRRDVLAALGGLASAVALGDLGCGPSAASEVVVYCSVDQVFAEPVLRAFEAASGIHVRPVFDTEEAKSTGVANRLIAEGAHPQADVFWSGDPVRPLALASQGLVEAYVSPSADGVPPAFRAADGTWTGVAARARVLLVNKAKAGGERPTSVRDLMSPRWKGVCGLANPVFGTTTMHAAALAVAWGDDGLRAFLDALKANDARVAGSNGEIKRLVAAGEIAFGLTDTDDANEAVKEGAPVEIVYPDQDALGTLVVPTSVVRIRGGPHREAAAKLIDALVSADTERRLSEGGAHMPLRASVPVPPGTRRATEIRAMTADFAQIAGAMERIAPWLRSWAGL